MAEEERRRMKQCLKVHVSGKVQGVGYREFVKKEAEKLGIEGTVHNSENGEVVIYACGMSNALDSLLDVLYKGTPKSNVTGINAEPFMKSREFRGVFRIIGVE
jgi:acylphosphatase